MLPPIYKSTNGLPNERLGSGIGAGFVGDGYRKQVAAALSLPASKHVGYPEPQSMGNLSNGVSDRMAERVHALERENEHFREELQHLRQLCSNNQLHHDNEKFSVSNIVEDLQRLAHSFNSKLQTDMNHQQREQQKAALLFAEVARLGHRVEGLESELRVVVDDTHRKLEAQEQHAQFMASLTSKQQTQPAGSPGRNAELQRQLRDMQDAMVQLRSELDSDRNARWKNDAAVDAKLDAQTERLNTKLATDKRDLARVLDEQRQLVTGADFQRVTTHMREFTRVNDHLLAMERWLHGEFGQVKRLFQTLAGDVDARFQCVLMEIANGLKVWHASQTRQEDELGSRIQDLEAATRAVVLVVQRKLAALEEVVPLEVQARQKNDDKLRRRVEGVVKALGHAIETSREELLPHQATLLHRVHQLELDQQSVLGQVEVQHNAMRETIQTFMQDSDSMLARLADTIEQERVKGMQSVAVPEVAPVAALTELATNASEEIRAEKRRVKEELDALQVWTAKHAQECRRFFDFLNSSMEDSRRESALVQCLDAVIDQIVETQALEQLYVLDRSVSGVLRQIEKEKAAPRATLVSLESAPQNEPPPAFDLRTDIDEASTTDFHAHSMAVEDQELADSSDENHEAPEVSYALSSPRDEAAIDPASDTLAGDQMTQLSFSHEEVEDHPHVIDDSTEGTLPDALAIKVDLVDAHQPNDDEDDNYSSMDTTQYSVDFDQLANSPTRHEGHREPPADSQIPPPHIINEEDNQSVDPDAAFTETPDQHEPSLLDL